MPTYLIEFIYELAKEKNSNIKRQHENKVCDHDLLDTDTGENG